MNPSLGNSVISGDLLSANRAKVIGGGCFFFLVMLSTSFFLFPAIGCGVRENRFCSSVAFGGDKFAMIEKDVRWRGFVILITVSLNLPGKSPRPRLSSQHGVAALASFFHCVLVRSWRSILIVREKD